MIAACLLALFLAPPARGAEPPPDAAILRGLTGQGWLIVGGQDPLPLDRCATLPLGARVCTDATSFATIRLAPRPDIPGAEDLVLLPGTCLDIEESGPDNARVRMSQGGISVAEDRSGQGNLSVLTRDGTTRGVLGGFRVSLEGTATRTEAVTGAVQLLGDGGQLELPAGKGSRLRPGQAPDAPQDLLPAEPLQAPPDDSALRRPDFRWQAVPLSTGYRVELSANADFTDIVEAIDVPDTAWSPDLLFVPRGIPGLWWRIASWDRFGFLGLPSTAWTLRLPGGVGTSTPQGEAP